MTPLLKGNEEATEKEVMITVNYILKASQEGTLV